LFGTDTLYFLALFIRPHISLKTFLAISMDITFRDS